MLIDIGHWQTDQTIDTKKYVGFVYMINNNADGRKYIGRKKYKVKKKKDDWRTYTGSCKELNEDIKRLGKDKFTFIILKQYETGPELNYAEAKLIMMVDAIFERSYYNQMIFLRTKGKKK